MSERLNVQAVRILSSSATQSSLWCLGYPVGAASIPVKRVLLTKKKFPGYPVHVKPNPGLPTPKRWEKLHPTESSGFGGEVGQLVNLFPRLWVG